MDMTVNEALSWATQKLQEARVPEPQTDAEWLLAHILKTSRTALKFNHDRVLADELLLTYEQMVFKRAERVPLAYIIGEQPFCGLILKVDERVMTPRQETEQLVELVSEKLKRMGNEHLMIADIGTGSGAIALAIAERFEGATVLGIDISAKALEVAEQNAQRLGLMERCIFLQGDLTEPLEAIFSFEVFDAIVANLPYVADSEWEKLMPEVRLYEPEIALKGGSEGLSVISQFIQRPLQRLLTPRGFIALEVGAGQAFKVQNLLRQRGWRQVTVRKDFVGIERFVFAQR